MPLICEVQREERSLLSIIEEQVSSAHDDTGLLRGQLWSPESTDYDREQWPRLITEGFNPVPQTLDVHTSERTELASSVGGLEDSDPSVSVTSRCT